MDIMLQVDSESIWLWRKHSTLLLIVLLSVYRSQDHADTHL